MGYPSISQYLESISNAFGLFRTLGEIEAERDSYGQVKFTSGSNAAIVRFLHEGEPYVLKCPIKQHPYRREIYAYIETHPDPLLAEARLLKDEIYVYDPLDKGAFYDVVIARWVEGRKLDIEIRKAARRNDTERLAALAREFDRLAEELLSRPWAHGDLKPDNIIVTPEGTLRLIDYDALFIPELAGKHSCELGTPPFQHPLRDEYFYNKHIDDYSVAVLSASLHALALDPSLYRKYNRADNLILFPEEVLAGRSAAYDQMLELFLHNGDHASYRMALLLLTPTPQIDALPALLSQIVRPVTASPGTAPVLTEENGRMGYLSAEGEPLIQAIYDDASEFRDGFATVRCGNHYLVIDTQGHVVLDGADYEIIKPFREGIAAVRKEGCWGYIGLRGETVAEPRFDMAGNMHEGRAVVRLDGKYGFIGRDGQIAIPVKFGHASGFRGGRAEVESDGKLLFINIHGEII